MKYLSAIYFIIILSCGSFLQAQYGWVKNYESSSVDQYSYDIVTTQDGGYYMGGYALHTIPSPTPPNTAIYPLLIRLDSDGDVVWRREYPSLIGNTIYAVEELPNGGALLVYSLTPTTVGVIGTTPTGAIDWTQSYTGNPPIFPIVTYLSCDLKRVSDGNFILHSAQGSIFKITPSGTVLWTTEAIDLSNFPHLSPHGNNIVEINPDSFVLIGGQEGGLSAALDMQAILIDGTGVLRRETLAPAGITGISAIKTNDQALLFCGNGANTTNDSLLLVKRGLDFLPIWSKKHQIDTFPIDVWDIIESPNGELLCLASEDCGGALCRVFLYVFDASGNYLRKIDLSNDLETTNKVHINYIQYLLSIDSGTFRAKLELSKDGQVVVGMNVYNFIMNNMAFAHIKLDSSGHTYPTLSGRVFEDANTDCIFNTGDSPFSQAIVKATHVSNGRTYYTISDTAGNYTMSVDTGSFTVEAFPINYFYWQSCAAAPITFAGQTSSTLDIGIQQIATCPFLQVDLSAPFLRATNGGSAYTVQVCNYGTASSPNTLVEVDFDSLLMVGNASANIINQVGNIYTFDVGNLAVGVCTTFTVQVVVNNTVLFPSTLCTEAKVYPDSICLPNYWSGPVVEVDGSCVNDTVVFEITNIGGNMSGALNYYVFEDHVMMRQGTFQLNNGGLQTIRQAALAGKTYRLSAQQPVGIPPLYSGSLATKVVTGCVLDTTGLPTIGIVNQFSNGFTQPFRDIDCQPAITAYDPNDKSAQPVGYQGQHYIDSTTILDYKIRFQNTGNDTAFYVMIKDTLSPHLDPSSIQMGASSHPYTWSLLNNGVLKVTFPDIQLVDSTTNEPLSHGFFTYSIHQQANNPVGTVINNRAAIYFDYNPPIITNTTFHTIGEDFIVTHLTTDQLYQEQVQVKVYPNPFRESTTLEVEGRNYQTLTLQVYDVAGRLQQSFQVQDASQLILHRGKLVQGMYIYTLQGDGELISSGKLVVQGQ